MTEETKESIKQVAVTLIYAVSLMLFSEQIGRAVKYYHQRQIWMLQQGLVYCYTDVDHSGWNDPRNCLK